MPSLEKLPRSLGVRLPRAIVVGCPAWWRRSDVKMVQAGDVNSTLGGHHCKRCGRRNGSLPGGFVQPTCKMKASCGCLVLYCDRCMADTWVVKWTDKGRAMKGKLRDIYWWHKGYGKSHKRTKECACIQPEMYAMEEVPCPSLT